MESKKKTPVWLLVRGGILAAYGGYLLNGIWEKGIDINTFMERLNLVMAHPIGNYFNGTTLKGILLAEFVYVIAIAMYLTSRRNYMPGKEYGTAVFANINQVNQALSEKDFESKCPYANGYQENQIKFEYACHRRQRGGKIFLLC